MRQILSGSSLGHWYTRAGSGKRHWERLIKPGDFMLTSQGDKEQIYVHGPGTWYQHLTVLALTQPVDDTAWATSWHGTFFITDTSGGTVDAVHGRFWPGTAFVAVTPCDANGSPATCPGPGYPANYLGQLNMYTGKITPVPAQPTLPVIFRC